MVQNLTTEDLAFIDRVAERGPAAASLPAETRAKLAILLRAETVDHARRPLKITCDK